MITRLSCVALAIVIAFSLVLSAQTPEPPAKPEEKDHKCMCKGCFITKDAGGKEQVWVRLNKKQYTTLMEYFDKADKADKEKKPVIKLSVVQKFRLARLIGLGMRGMTKIKSEVQVVTMPITCEKCKHNYWVFPKENEKDLLIPKQQK